MRSIKCPKCGLVNFAEASVCKRCQEPLNGTSSGAASPVQVSPDESETNANRKLFGQVFGGGLIGVGLLLGIAVAFNQDYSLLPYAGVALLIGAFLVVILTQPRYSESWKPGVIAVRVGITFTLLGSSMVYYYGLWTPRTFVPLLGIALIVLGVVAFRNRG